MLITTPLSAGIFTLSSPLTDDGTSGISLAESYTHTISGGTAATVNGVAFAALTPTVTPANAVWNAGGVKNIVSNNNNTWNPAAGGVTGAGLKSLLGSFTYSGTSTPGSFQTFTLSGLSVGTPYDARLYIRVWDKGGAGRFINLTMTHGAEINTLEGGAEDRPGDALGTANQDQAYYINYSFVAKASTLEIKASVPATASATNGSFHMYALSNQVAKFSVSDPLSDDETSGIKASNTYTHAISGGRAATVNGVEFALLNTGATPDNFEWTATGGKAIVTNNNSAWNPADGGVTGSGLQALLGSFTYSGGGANPGSSQTFILSGLTAGTVYETRFYIRVWDKGGGGRFIDFTANNGTDIDTFTGRAEDRPGDVLGTGNPDHAYYINYHFTAKTNQLEVVATVPDTAPANSGSFHMYALSNQVFGTALDSDGDGLPNDWETANGLDPNDNGSINVVNGANGDPDTDGLKNGDEYLAGTNPKDADTDKDGLKDGAEKAVGGNPTKPDTDKDGLNDGDEVARGTKVNQEDSDNDSFLDGFEVAKGSNPLDAASVPPPSGKFKLSKALTDNASSGISPTKTYTHAISGGTAATVNGVTFAALTATNTLPNFAWVSAGGKNTVNNNNSAWDPAAGGVTSPDLISLLQSFTYAGSGAGPGAFQTFTLSGLTVGTAYDARLYIRVWDKGGSGRLINYSMSHGSEIDNFLDRQEDRPGTVLGSDNQDEAYFLNYRFIAKGTSLEIKASVPATAPAGSGSFHMYGLSNEVVQGSPGTFSLSAPLTDDETSGISRAITYTHTVSGGTPATVNGVDFVELSGNESPDNLIWNAPDGKNLINSINNAWNPNAGGVTGTGLVDLLKSFTYSGGGDRVGAFQTFTLTGLSAGTTYDARLYIRVWDAGSGGRPINYTMTHGFQQDSLDGRKEDRPDEVLGTTNRSHAYYINYRFTAQGTELEIKTTVGNPNSGSFHMYALSNQVVPTATGTLPALSIVPAAGNRVTVSWPPATTGWVLKSSPTMGASSWSLVPGVVNNSVTQNVDKLKFFRLEK